MSKSGGNTLTEYVIRLGASMDSDSLKQLLSIMDTTKLKAIGLTAAFGAISTAIYKFVEATTKQEFAMRQLAKQKKKSIEQTRAEEQALKAMGKTLNEIKKDKALKEMYDDLVKFNKELALPNADNALKAIRGLQTEFYKLKSAVNYTVQAIGIQVMTNLTEPIKRITGGLTSISEWVKKNLNSIASKVGSYISSFAKGIIGIGETLGKIVKWVSNTIPDGIRSIGGAIAVVLTMLNSGPLGRIITALTMIGDVIHDYENYEWNRRNETPEGPDGNGQVFVDENGKFNNEGKGTLYKIPIAYESIWDFWFSDGTGELSKDKVQGLAGKIVPGITQILQEVEDLLSGDTSLENMLGTPASIIGKIFGGIFSYIKSPAGATELGDLISQAVNTAASVLMVGGQWTSQVVQSIGSIIATAFDKNTEWDKSDLKKIMTGKNGIINALFTGLDLSLIGADPLTAIIGGALGGWKTERNKALKSLYKQMHPETPDEAMSHMTTSYLESWVKEQGLEKEVNSELMLQLQTDFNDTLSGIMDTLYFGFSYAGEITGGIIDLILNLILKNNPGELSTHLEEVLNSEGGKQLTEIIGNGIAGWIATGSFWGGVFGAAGTALAEAQGLVMSGKASDLGKGFEMVLDNLGKVFADLWEGPLEGKYNGSMLEWTRNEKLGLKSVFNRLLWGSDNPEDWKYELTDVFEMEGNKLGEKTKAVVAKKGGILSWLLGVETTDADGRRYKTVGALQGLWDGIKSGFEGLWDLIKDPVMDVASQIAGVIKSALDDVWMKFWNDNPILQVLFGNPNEGSVTVDDEGNVIFSSTGNYQYAHLAEEYTPEALKFLATMLPYFPANAQGLPENFGTHGFNNDSLTGVNGFSGDPEIGTHGWSDLITWVLLNGKMPTDSNGNTFSTESIITNYNNQNPQSPISIKNLENASGGVAQLGNASGTSAGQVAALGSSASTASNEALKAAERFRNANPATQSALGGRFSQRTNTDVGEDGTEYIIPITKPARALDLIMQMFNEMGTGAVNRIFAGLGIGQSGTNGASMASLSTAMQGMQMVNNVNISAPMNIHVNSTGADAKEIGTSIYDMAERHLIKNLTGVYG